jgi:membrane-associated phospholipid phosphatase
MTEGSGTSRFAPRMVLGLVIIALGIAGFVVLADAAREGDGLAAFDPRLTQDFVTHRTAGLSSVARAFTFIGNVPVLSAFTVIAAALLRVGTRRWRSAVILTVAMIGAATLTYILKVLIGRHRPDANVVLGTVNHGFSFPSGHTLSSAVFFLLLAALLWYSKASRITKVVGTLAATAMCLAIGLSRIYLGYHWATDVLAGWTMALTWLCVLATAVSVLSPRAAAASSEGHTA